MAVIPGPDLRDRRVVVPGGTGTVGSGVVRRYLAAGAQVVVPTRTEQRAAEFRSALGELATDRLHLVVHDYSVAPAAERVAAQMERSLGGVDDVVAPIGGWWAGKQLWEVSDADWSGAFVGLLTAHLSVVRAFLPRMSAVGAYTVVVGESATFPVPGSGLVSMEQAALLMMQQVLAAEAGAGRRAFALVLGPVSAQPDPPRGDEVGAVAVAASASGAPSARVALRDRAEVTQALQLLRVGAPA